MAVTENLYTGNGSSTNYSFTFPYLETTDIKVSINGTITTAYTLANPTTIQFTTAPANGAAIRIYRVTDDSALAATFYSGAAIRATDLNENFTQNLYVTQESNREATTAITTANSATSTANTALSTANAATVTANTASTNASAAVATANTANTNASAAVSTANTASSNATTAVNTANAATATANTASTNASTALSTANTALSTANTASTNATTAVNTANSAASTASSAVSTANTASTNASNAVTTANTASSNATTAVNTANSAVTTANNAAAAVANAQIFTIVAAVANIPGSPANNAAIEVTNSTGIESFTPLAGKPAGFIGNSGLSVRITYSTSGSTWNWVQYFPNDPESRYLKTGTGTVTSTNIADGTIVNADISATAAIAPSKISGTAVVDADARLTDTRTPTDGSVTNAKVNASAAIAGTKISPDFGSQNVITTGTATAAALIPSGSSVPTNGVYLPSSNNVAISTNGVQRINIEADGDINIDGGGVFYDATNNRLGIGTTSPGAPFDCSIGDRGLQITAVTSGYVQLTGTQGSASSNLRPMRIVANTLSLNTGVDTGTSYTERLLIDSSGRVGIGTANPTSALHIDVASGEPLRFRSRTSGSNYFTHVNHAGGDLAYVGAGGGAALGSGTTSDYAIRANQGALLFGTNGNNERARIDSSGRLLVGTSTGPAGATVVFSGNAFDGSTGDGRLYLNRGSTPSSGSQLGAVYFSSNNGANDGASILAVRDGGTWTAGSSHPTLLKFSVTQDGSASPSERLRISQNGGIGSFMSSAGAYFRTSEATTSTTNTLAVAAGATTTTNGTNTFVVEARGNVYNQNNSYGSLSDIKLKENIVDANSQWDDLKALQVRNYNFKEGQTHTQIGLIAQEVELVSPGLVSESSDRDAEGNDLGTVTKSVNYSVLYMKAVKALQEAMERIETLEAKVAALEGV